MIHEIHWRLQEWAAWRLEVLHPGAYRYRSVLADIYDNRGASSGGNHAPISRTSATCSFHINCLELELCVRRAPPNSQRVLLVFYCGACTFRGADDIAAGRCARPILRATDFEVIFPKRDFHEQLRSAHSLIRSFLNQGIDYSAWTLR